jgi:hypothetical protein
MENIEIKKIGGGIHRQQTNLISMLLFLQNKESRLSTQLCQYAGDQSPGDSSRGYVI